MGQFTGGSLQVTGTWAALANGNYTDNTMLTGTEAFTLPATCLALSGTITTCDNIGVTLPSLGFASGTCANASNGGCACTGSVQQAGGLGFVSVNAVTNGMYTTGNNSLTDTADGAIDPYCVSGNTLSLTPQGTMGTIVLSSSSSGGSSSGSSGGSSGSSGSSSSGSSGSSSGSSGSSSSGSSGSSSGSMKMNTVGPCDIYASASPATPCVAAYSTTRVLSSTYTGPLYQVRKGGTNNVFNGNQTQGTGGGTSGGMTMDIGASASHYADTAAQDAFCGTGATPTCTISKLYDQSGNGNDLIEAPAGQQELGPDYEVPIGNHSLTISGNKVYSVFFPNPPTNLPAGSAPQGYGYRNNKTSGVPTKNASQGIYMLADGTHAGTACCFDFGNAETNNGSGPTGAMASLNFGTTFWGQGAGTAPWFEGDFEAGVWAGGSACGTPGSGQLTCNGRTANPMNPSMKGVPYAFGVLDTTATNYAIKAGNAANGGNLTVAYSGVAPANFQLQGAVVLGIGGDNSNSSWGTFYEGALTAGQPSDATDQAVFANVAAAGYGK